MKKAAIIVVSGLILIVAFAYLIYPTPYRYDSYTTEGGWTIPVRENILTGVSQEYEPNEGWKDAGTD